MAELVEMYRRELGWAGELRRKEADWAYIESRPEPLRTALGILVETGDLWYAAALTGVDLEGLNEERIRARIPIVVV